MAVLLRSCFLFTASLLPCNLFPFLCPDSLFARRLGGGWVAVEGGVAACGAWHVGGIAQHTAPARCAARRSDLSTLRLREPRFPPPVLVLLRHAKPCSMLLHLTPPHLPLPINSGAQIRQGLLEAPQPKVKISNLMRVLGAEATAGAWLALSHAWLCCRGGDNSFADLRTACALWAGAGGAGEATAGVQECVCERPWVESWHTAECLPVMHVAVAL